MSDTSSLKHGCHHGTLQDVRLCFADHVGARNFAAFFMALVLGNVPRIVTEVLLKRDYAVLMLVATVTETTAT